jgi:hypothetical protein
VVTIRSCFMSFDYCAVLYDKFSQKRVSISTDPCSNGNFFEQYMLCLQNISCKLYNKWQVKKGRCDATGNFFVIYFFNIKV